MTHALFYPYWDREKNIQATFIFVLNFVSLSMGLSSSAQKTKLLIDLKKNISNDNHSTNRNPP